MQTQYKGYVKRLEREHTSSDSKENILKGRFFQTRENERGQLERMLSNLASENELGPVDCTRCLKIPMTVVRAVKTKIF